MDRYPSSLRGTSFHQSAELGFLHYWANMRPNREGTGSMGHGFQGATVHSYRGGGWTTAVTPGSELCAFAALEIRQLNGAAARAGGGEAGPAKRLTAR